MRSRRHRFDVVSGASRRRARQAARLAGLGGHLEFEPTITDFSRGAGVDQGSDNDDETTRRR